MDRLSPVVIAPSCILDLGAASGRGSRQIAKKFKKSRVIGFDASAGMLRIAKRNRPLFSKLTELRGDAMHIPLRTGSIDLAFANLLLPWVDNLPACLVEIARVLKKGGVFAFATLGPDSLAELRDAWAAADSGAHVNAFPDMHEVGDALTKAGLVDPVLDVDFLTVTYRDNASLYRDLTSSGARNSLIARRQTLTGKNRFSHMEDRLRSRRENGQLPVTLELVYGHAWGAGPRPQPGEFHLEPAAITRRTRR